MITSSSSWEKCTPIFHKFDLHLSTYLESGHRDSSMSRDAQASLSAETYIHFFQENPKAFPGQPRDKVPPAHSGSSRGGLLPVGYAWGGIEEASEKNGRATSNAFLM